MSSFDGIGLTFAEELTAFEYNRLTRDDIEQLQRLVLDYAAVTLCGSVQPWGRKLNAWATRHGADGKATLVGSGHKAGAATAGLVNGTSAHGYELDDTHDKAMCHPGAVVITAALAVGAETGASGPEMLAAITTGYEAMARIGMAANALEVIGYGYHPTCLFGVFGSATAAARLLALDAEGLALAWGLALSMTGGVNQFAFEPKGTMVKRMHAGLPAQNGIIAAQLAGLGVAGPMKALEGELGFFKVFGKNPDPSILLAKDVDAPLEIHDISLKPYSCCRKFHSLIDALGEATEDFTLNVDNIDAIKVLQPENAIGQHMMRRPDSVMAAQYSMPYIVGATLAHGPRRYDAYGTDHHGETKILDVIDKVESVHRPDLDPHYPAKMPHGVSLTLKDGTVRESLVMDSLGTPVRPLSTDGVLEKAKALLAPLAPRIALDEIIADVEALTTIDDVGALAGHMIIPNYDASDDAKGESASMPAG